MFTFLVGLKNTTNLASCATIVLRKRFCTESSISPVVSAENRPRLGGEDFRRCSRAAWSCEEGCLEITSRLRKMMLGHTENVLLHRACDLRSTNRFEATTQSMPASATRAERDGTTTQLSNVDHELSRYLLQPILQNWKLSFHMDGTSNTISELLRGRFKPSTLEEDVPPRSTLAKWCLPSSGECNSE